MGNPLTELPIEALRARRSIKWRTFAPDVLPLWVAEMDVVLAPPITKALAASVERGDTGYAHPGRLREAFSGYAQRTWNWSPDPAQMVVVPDVLRGIVESLLLCTRPGDGIVINTPAYPPFFSSITAIDRRVVESPLRRDADGRYHLDLEALDRDLARDDVAIYLLCNPHNPTGIVCTRDELLAVAEMAERHRVRLFVDEIHAPLVYPGHTHTPMASVPAQAATEAIVFTSASKAWNLAGLKAAIAIAAGPPAWTVLSTMPPEATFGTGLPGVIAGEAAFDQGEVWLASVLAALDQNRGLLAHLLEIKVPEAGYVMPDATYLAWLDLRALELGDNPALPLLERGRVALSSGPDFGAPGRGFARLNLATSPWNLKEAVRRIAAVRAGGTDRVNVD